VSESGNKRAVSKTQKEAKPKRRFFKGKNPTKALLDEIFELAANGIKQQTIADTIGVSRSRFSKWMAEDGPVAIAWRQGNAEIGRKIMQKSIEKALGGHATMLIWLGKALLGLSDQPDREEEVTDKAAAIRETLDQMNAGLERFTGKDGSFADPDAGGAKSKKRRPKRAPSSSGASAKGGK